MRQDRSLLGPTGVGITDADSVNGAEADSGMVVVGIVVILLIGRSRTLVSVRGWALVSGPFWRARRNR